MSTIIPPPSVVEAKTARRISRRQGLFAPDLLKTALVRSFVMLRPDIQWKNPVMFTVEVGTVLSILYTVAKIWSTRSLRADARIPDRPGRVAVPDGAVRQLRRGAGRGARQGPGRCPAQDPPGDAGLQGPPSRRQPSWTCHGSEAIEAGRRPRRANRLHRVAGRRPGGRRGRAGHPGRRRDHRRRRLGGRVGHHRRVGPGDPRGRRRPLRRHRRHARPVRPHRRADHRRGRQVVPRPHDRPGRGRHPPADAERDRPVAGAVRVHAHLPDRHARPCGRWPSNAEQYMAGLSGQ